MAKNNDDDLLEDDAQFKDEYELNLEEEDALLALNEDEVSVSDSCGDRSGEVEYVDEDGNPVSVHEGRSLQVVAVHEGYGYGSQEAGNDEEDILEVGIDPEYDALGQETDEFEAPRNSQDRSREQTPRAAPSPSSRESSVASQPSTPIIKAEVGEKGFGRDDDAEADGCEEGQGVDDEEDDDEDGEKRRGRFRAERGESSATTAKRRDRIPDSLDAVISAEDAAKVDAYLNREEERKRNRRGGMARGAGVFRKRGHRGAGGNRSLQQHIDPWMPHSGPMALQQQQQGRFLSPNMVGPQRRFQPRPCIPENNMRAKIFVNPQFHNGNMPPGGLGLHNDAVGMGRPPQFSQLPHQQGVPFHMRQESFSHFVRPPVLQRPEQRVPPFSQGPGGGRGYQQRPPLTTFSNNGPHSAAPPQFSTAGDRFAPTSRPTLEPFEMPPPHIDFGPGRNGEFPPRRDVEPWAHPVGAGQHGIAPGGARQQSQPFGSPPHYTNALLHPPQQHHMSSPVPAHPFPVVSQHCPPPQIALSGNQQDQRYPPRPPLHFQPHQGGPPPQQHHGPPPPMQPPCSMSPSAAGGAFGHPQFAQQQQQRSPRLGEGHGPVLRKRTSSGEGVGQGPLILSPVLSQPKVMRMDSPRANRAPMGRTVNSSNIKEVPIVENLPPPEPVKAALPKEVEEDSETLELRRKIEEQKKLREQVLRIKAERRKLAAMQRQRDVLEKNLNSSVPAGEVARNDNGAAAPAAPATLAAVNKQQQAVKVQKVEPPEKPAVSVKERLGLKPNAQVSLSPGQGPPKKVVIVRRNPPQQQQAVLQPKQPSRNVISLCPQGQAVRHPPPRPGGIVGDGRGAFRSVLRPSLPPQRDLGTTKKVIKIVPTPKVRPQVPPLRTAGSDVLQRAGHQGVQMPATTQVLVNNLCASTSEAQLKQLGSTCGVITGIVLDRIQKRAVIGFQDQLQAFTFQKKYQRHMLDLSMIQVSLLPP